MLREERVSFRSGKLELEGLLHRGDSSLAAVVLHPHPQYGGDMHNAVVAALCGCLADAGASTLRFNTRGVGESEGSFDGGRGEADDAVAAVAHVRELLSPARLALAGYSFGATVAASAAARVEAAALLLVSPPGIDRDRLPAGTPALVVTGEMDPIATADAARRLDGAATRVVVVPDADHFWMQGAREMTDAVRAFLRDTVGAPSG